MKEYLKEQPERLPVIGGTAEDFLETPDKVVLKPPPQADPLTKILRRDLTVRGLLGEIFKVSFRRDLDILTTDISQRNPQDPRFPMVAYFSERKIEIGVILISWSFASAILISSIVGLHFVDSENVRLALICVFTVVFAGGVFLTTTASRSEIFGASAA